MDGTMTPRPGLRSQIWQFARHYLEMCAVMCAGGLLLNALVFLGGPALIGYPDLRQQSPELGLLVAAANYALAMTVWMRVRGMAWRPTLEMAGATIGVAVVVTAVAWLGFIPGSSLSVGARLMPFCGQACLIMLVTMLFRLGLYTGRSASGTGHGTHGRHAAHAA